MAKVLVVDDDPDSVTVASRVLEMPGYRVVSASNGAQAMKSARQNPPDLVLQDLMMSYILGGLDVGREMASDPVLRDIPVIMVASITGLRGSNAFPTDDHVAVDQWLSKPAEPHIVTPGE